MYTYKAHKSRICKLEYGFSANVCTRAWHIKGERERAKNQKSVIDLSAKSNSREGEPRSANRMKTNPSMTLGSRVASQSPLSESLSCRSNVKCDRWQGRFIQAALCALFRVRNITPLVAEGVAIIKQTALSPRTRTKTLNSGPKGKRARPKTINTLIDRRHFSIVLRWKFRKATRLRGVYSEAWPASTRPLFNKFLF